jgi:hypothetical protein
MRVISARIRRHFAGSSPRTVLEVGKPIVLNFWANMVFSARLQEMPWLEKFYHKHGESILVILGLSTALEGESSSSGEPQKRVRDHRKV